jgi:hypothetical protein
MVKFLAKNWSKLVLVFYTVTFPLISLAEVVIDGGDKVPCSQSGKICNPINVNSLEELVGVILSAIVKLGIPVVAVMIIYSGFLFVFARGNSEKIEKARDSLLYTLIGAAILFGAWALTQLLVDTVDTLK